MDIKECFEILDINPNSSLEDVKQSYRDMLNVWHPDRYSHNERLQQKANEKTKEILEAYNKIKSYLSSKVTQSNDTENEIKVEKKKETEYEYSQNIINRPIPKEELTLEEKTRNELDSLSKRIKFHSTSEQIEQILKEGSLLIDKNFTDEFDRVNLFAWFFTSLLHEINKIFSRDYDGEYVFEKSFNPFSEQSKLQRTIKKIQKEHFKAVDRGSKMRDKRGRY